MLVTKIHLFNMTNSFERIQIRTHTNEPIYRHADYAMALPCRKISQSASLTARTRASADRERAGSRGRRSEKPGAEIEAVACHAEE